MTLPIIKSPDGREPYVRLPVPIYEVLKDQIDELLERQPEKTEVGTEANGDYIPFDPANYVQNPVALARIRAHLSREELARQLGISVSYLGKIERSTQVREKMLARVKRALSESNC